MAEGAIAWKPRSSLTGVTCCRAGMDPELRDVLGYPIGDVSSQARSSQPANMMPRLKHAVDSFRASPLVENLPSLTLSTLACCWFSSVPRFSNSKLLPNVRSNDGFGDLYLVCSRRSISQYLREALLQANRSATVFSNGRKKQTFSNSVQVSVSIISSLHLSVRQSKPLDPAYGEGTLAYIMA